MKKANMIIAAILSFAMVFSVFTVSTISVSAATPVDSAVSWAIAIAGNSNHGYDQISRWGPDYDCSSFVISAYQQAGVKVKDKGATYTGNMYTPFTKSGFIDVTKQINLSTGSGLKKGDVLLNTVNHAAMVSNVSGSNITIVHASINENGATTGGKTGDQNDKEILTTKYWSYPWNYVLRHVTYTIAYKANGGTGTMANTVVTYGIGTPLRNNAFTLAGCDFTGWYANRNSDNKWLYRNSSKTQDGWYKEGSQPTGWVKNMYGNGVSVSKTSSVNNDIINFYAQWKVKKPTITANESTYNYNVRRVTFTITVPSGSTVYYTTNGTNPTTSSTRYSNALTFDSPIGTAKTYTIKAIAVKSGYPNSDVATLTRTVR